MQNLVLHHLIFLLISALTFFNCEFITAEEKNLTGVYWGAFDPPTAAHAAIISASIQDIPLKKLIVVVNNHPYKNYTYPLKTRLQMLQNLIKSHQNADIELLTQDENNKIDFPALKTMTKGPLCAISGYDAYKRWMNFSDTAARLLYDRIAVVPRGDDLPVLIDENAFVLPIDSKYRHVSSTKEKLRL
jgi:cytidyltransferase-like protein